MASAPAAVLLIDSALFAADRSQPAAPGSAVAQPHPGFAASAFDRRSQLRREGPRRRRYRPRSGVSCGTPDDRAQPGSPTVPTTAPFSLVVSGSEQANKNKLNRIAEIFAIDFFISNSFNLISAPDDDSFPANPTQSSPFYIDFPPTSVTKMC